MGLIKKIFFFILFIILLIIIICIISYFYIRKYLFNNYENIDKLQGFNKLNKEQNLLRKYIFKKPDYNKRFLIKNIINKNEIKILKNIYKNYSINVASNINNQININLSDSYAKIPINNDKKSIDEIIEKIKKKTELLYNKKLKLDYYTICLNQKNTTTFPHADCKSFDVNNNKFIDNICPNRHFSISILLNNVNNYKGGKFKFCNDDKVININKGDAIIFDTNEIHEVTKIKKGKRLVIIIWFTKI